MNVTSAGNTRFSQDGNDAMARLTDDEECDIYLANNETTAHSFNAATVNVCVFTLQCHSCMYC